MCSSDLVLLPDGASLQRTARVGETLQQSLAKNPAVEHVFLINGFDLISGGAKTSSATLFLAMKPWEDRTISAQQMVGAVFGAGAGIRDADVGGSDAEDHARRPRRHASGAYGQPEAGADHRVAVDGGLEQVHLRTPDERPDEQVRGRVVELLRRRDLLDHAVT